MQWCVKDTGRKGVIWNVFNSVKGFLIISPLLDLHVPTWSTWAWNTEHECVCVGGQLTARSYLHTEEMWTCMHESAGVASVRCSGLSNTEPPVSYACCFTCEPRCASALLQLSSPLHSNLRHWELKARWTFFNNEGILCLQYSTWLTRAVWAALQQFKGKQTYFSSSLLHVIWTWRRPIVH